MLDGMEWPAVLTIDMLVNRAQAKANCTFGEWLKDRRNSRQIPHRLEAAGYEPVRNPSAKDGLFVVNGKRQVIYAQATLSVRDRHTAAAGLNQRNR